jgi:hypothetical protein
MLARLTILIDDCPNISVGTRPQLVAAAHGPVSLGAGRKRVAMCTARASYPHDLAKFVRKLICKEKQ